MDAYLMLFSMMWDQSNSSIFHGQESLDGYHAGTASIGRASLT